MAEEYCFDRGNMAWALLTQQKVRDEIEEAYKKALEIYNSVKKSYAWSGKSKETFLSYMNLVLQYHGALIQQKVEEKSKLAVTFNFANEACEAIRECTVNMIRFPDESTTVREMEGVQ